MHVVFGGLFNGKTDFVKEQYEPQIFIDETLDCEIPTGTVVAITNFPMLVQPFYQLDEMEAANRMLHIIEQITMNNTVVCICDDISRGVVPLDKTERQMRDILGRLYQQLFTKAKTVTQIWYGIPKQLK